MKPCEGGSLTAFMAVLAVSLFVLVGLVVDTGRAVAARELALQQAQQAARTGATELSLDALRSGQISIDPTAAIEAADNYLASVGQVGTVSISGQTVTVHITTSEPTVILGIVDINHIALSVTASATKLSPNEWCMSR